jgi:hypothetical protein
VQATDALFNHESAEDLTESLVAITESRELLSGTTTMGGSDGSGTSGVHARVERGRARNARAIGAPAHERAGVGDAVPDHVGPKA